MVSSILTVRSYANFHTNGEYNVTLHRQSLIIQLYYIPILMIAYNSNIQMAAGGTNMLMYMRQRSYESIYGTVLCDYKSKIDHDNGYSCEPCPNGYFSASIANGCIACSKVASTNFGTDEEKSRMQMLCE